MLNEMLKERKKSFLGEIAKQESAKETKDPKPKRNKINRRSIRKTIKLDETPPKIRE